MAAASIVFKDNEEYSKKLIHSAIMIFKFSRQYRGRYSAGGVEAGWFYNSTSYWDELPGVELGCTMQLGILPILSSLQLQVSENKPGFSGEFWTTVYLAGTTCLQVPR